MQIRKVKIIAHAIASLFLLPLSLLDTASCQKEADCEEHLKIIARAYNDGDWTRSKNASLHYLNSIMGKDVIHFSPVPFKYPQHCKTNIPQVYYYLIQSYLRLYNVDSAKMHYYDALTNEYKINLDTSAERLFKQFGTVKKHSANLYLGIISADIRETKLGVTYGLTPRLFVEMSFNNRHFNHSSEDGDGVLGKPLVKDPVKSPSYSFRFQGYERYLEFGSYIKTPLFVSQKDVNIFYVSIGCFATYYLNSYVNTWDLARTDSLGTTAVYLPFARNKRYVQVDTLNLKMDLKRLYQDRFNYGIYMNLGTSVNLRNRWEMFFEIKFAVGKNNRYRYKEFASYRPGVDYFFLVLGITKKFYKIRERRQ